MKKYVSALIFVGVYTFSVSAVAGKRAISEIEFGEEWPFTVPEGILDCSDRKITFTTIEGDVYGVNGTAKNFGHKPIEPIWKINTPMLKELAEAFDQTIDEVIGEDPPPRISIGPIIKVGLELCE